MNLIIACSVLVSMASALTRTAVMRKESPEVLAMSASGDLIDMGTDTDPDVPEVACNDEYPLGKKDTSECMLEHHDLIVDPEMCQQAATITNAGVVRPDFVLSEEWWEKHPRGCFAWPCPSASSKTCYFYNPVGDDPCKQNHTDKSKCEGTPVCFAAHYNNGTVNANGGCSAGYAPVMDEKKCEAAASCLGYCAGAQFRIGIDNASKHMEFPEGCFIHEEEGCFYFNAPSDMGKPTNPKGTPVCNATEPGHYWPDKVVTTATKEATSADDAAEGKAAEDAAGAEADNAGKAAEDAAGAEADNTGKAAEDAAGAAGAEADNTGKAAAEASGNAATGNADAAAATDATGAAGADGAKATADGKSGAAAKTETK